MCGRYRLDDEADMAELYQIIDEVNRHGGAASLKTSGEVFPTDVVPVAANSRQGKPSAFAMRWGYALPDGKRLINARSETAASRPLFRDGMLERRCAVPASEYFEWERIDGSRRKYAIRPAGSGLFYMAGIYRLESGEPAFSILTREPADSIAFIHDRMPVILPQELVRDWINPKYDAAEILVHAVLDVAHRPAPTDEQMHMAL